MKKFYLVCLTLLSFGLSSDVTVEQMSDIESRVGSMSLNELQDRRSFLTRQERQLMATQASTQNPSTVKTTSSRIKRYSKSTYCYCWCGRNKFID